MGFGLGGISDAVKSAVHHVSDAVGGAAKKVGDGVQAAEQKVAGVVKSAVDGARGHDGFDHPNHGHTYLVDSKPKGGSSATGGTQFV
jgi:hypothetical protein